LHNIPQRARAHSDSKRQRRHAQRGTSVEEDSWGWGVEKDSALQALKRTAREIIAEIIVKVEMFSQALKRTAGEIIAEIIVKVEMFDLLSVEKDSWGDNCRDNCESGDVRSSKR
jgi:hypothetical protein